MSLIKSIATLGGWTVVSRLVGFVRDMCIAKFLGATLMADAFFVAFRLPNLFRSFFAEGSLNVSFIPLFTGLLSDKEKAKQFAVKVFSFLFYVLLITTIVMEFFMPQVIDVMAPGFSKIAGKSELTTSLSRITFPFLMMISLVSLYSCILNSLGKFGAPAFTPALMNIIMITGLFVLTPFFTKEAPAYALSWSVFLAGAVEFIFLGFFVKKEGFRLHLLSPRKTFDRPQGEMKLFLKRMVPGIFGSGIYQINLFFDVFLVSFLGAGAVSWLNYAHHLFQLPVGIIGVSLGTALLPIISAHLKKGDKEKAFDQLNRGMEIALAMSLGAMFGLVTLSVPIIRTLFQRGAFTYDTTLKTAAALEAYALGLPAYMMTKTLQPLFYAKGDTATPVKIATVGLLLNIVLSISFIPFWGYVGIALATGVATWINLGQYVFLLHKEGEFHPDKLFKKRCFRIILSSLLMALSLLSLEEIVLKHYYSWNLLEGTPLYLIAFGLIGVGGIVFVASLFLFKVLSIREIKSFIRKKA